MASSFGDALEVMLLNWAFTDAEAPTRPNAWYISLHTGDPGESGANELSSGTNKAGYARQQATFSDASTGAAGCSNEAAETFTSTEETNDWDEVTHFGVWSAASAGTFYGGGSLAASKTVGPGDTATFAIGALDITMT